MSLNYDVNVLWLNNYANDHREECANVVCATSSEGYLICYCWQCIENASCDRDDAVHPAPRLCGVEPYAGPGQQHGQPFDGQQSQSTDHEQHGRRAAVGRGAAVPRRPGQDHRSAVSSDADPLHGPRPHRRRRKHLHLLAGNTHTVCLPCSVFFPNENEN